LLDIKSKFITIQFKTLLWSTFHHVLGVGGGSGSHPVGGIGHGNGEYPRRS